VHYRFGRWLVNASVKGLVKLRIDPAAPARVWTMSVPVSELWVGVTDPDALVAACTAK
jgi:hypothetical protein